eukprot:TRINITY_DN55928_c0_g2_i2.p1 TRINITY_DN55928_c0_g2~~TRINITY_DN55928_c0_g2_i2.p1  ORF type:complete len:525 (+),score=162.93 TRINITY_DN55928_c0_g2_i2:50-1624(+)
MAAAGTPRSGGTGGAEADPMRGVVAPPAKRPALGNAEALAARRALAAEVTVPSFDGHGDELLDFQKRVRDLADCSTQGKRLCAKLTARLQRGDAGGAEAILTDLKKLPLPEAAIGATLWAEPERRLRLCDSGNVTNFIESYVASLGLLSFMETGVLTPPMPEAWKLGIEDQDDERYLCGIIDAARELDRFAVNRGQVLDLPTIQVCLGVVQALEQALMQFDFRNSDLRRRFDGIKYVVKKLENLAYEVDMALKRAAESAAAAGKAGMSGGGGYPPVPPFAEQAADSCVTKDEAATLGSPAIDLSMMAAIKQRYDAFDKMREDAIKRARDVIKLAKNATYALQRGDFKKADKDLEQAAKLANGIYAELVSKTPSLRGGFFSAAMEELAEALLYRAFRKDWHVYSLEELQSASKLQFKLTLIEYLGGVLDLTGEVCRYAVRMAGQGHQAVPTIEKCLVAVDGIYASLQELPMLPGGIGKKMGPLKGTLGKIEGVRYELALLTRGGMRVQAAPAAPVDAGSEKDDAP